MNWLLLPLAATLLILDVAIRRLQIDKAGLLAGWAGVTGFVQSFTTVRRSEGTQAVDALRKIRERGEAAPAAATANAPAARPDPKRKFEATKPVTGDISQVVGGAKNQPVTKPSPATARPASAGPAGRYDEQPAGGETPGAGTNARGRQRMSALPPLRFTNETKLRQQMQSRGRTETQLREALATTPGRRAESGGRRYDTCIRPAGSRSSSTPPLAKSSTSAT